MTLAISLSGCGSGSSKSKAQTATAEKGVTVSNPVFHFEIPVRDMDRAVRFYETVFETSLTRETVDGYQMAFFPRPADRPGASGALAQGEVYVLSKTGPIIYFDVPDIDPVLRRATSLGAAILYLKKHIGEAGYVAEIKDSEGNRIALSAVED
jgi:uncharacterized protein